MNCPKCGAEKSSAEGNIVMFECQSFVGMTGGIVQSRICDNNVLKSENARLQEERDALEDKVDLFRDASGLIGSCGDPSSIEPKDVEEYYTSIVDENNRMKDGFRDNQVEIARLQAIVDKLDVSADGVLITPGMNLYQLLKRCDGSFLIEEHSMVMAAYTGDVYDPSEIDAGEYYSTEKSAAEAARTDTRDGESVEGGG